MNKEMFQGRVIPTRKDDSVDTSCFNSHCQGVSCLECINYPSLTGTLHKIDYLYEKNRDEYISEGIERVSDV